MTPERWQQVEDVLQAALDRAPAERAVFLSEACSGDEELARETTSLIEAYDQAGDFIEEPAIAQDAEIILSGREPDLRGKKIGPYQIIDRIAVSGMAEVYLARDPRLDRMVALKVLPAYFGSDDDRLRRFQIEARAASALNHANILTIYEVGQSEEIFFIAAEHIEGPTIRQLIRAGNLSLGETLEIVDQILWGLTAAHTSGIVHRDIKPENVMRRNDGVVKILDFGIAKLLERSSSQTSATETEFGLLLGTIGYMSPEQVRAWPVDERSDLWSCGVVLYEMLTRRRPFGGIANADVIVAILEREPEPLFGISEPADPVLRTIQSVVNKALRKDPAERYQTAAEMRTDLAQIKQELAVEKDSRSQRAISLQTSVSEFPEIAARTIPRKMRREILVLVAAAMLVALFAGLFLYQRYKSRSGTAPAATVTKKPYLQMSPAEQLVFVEAQEQRISAMMGDRPVKLNDEALRAIKTRVDRYAARQDSASLKEGQESLRTVFARATPQIPIISRAFNDRRIPIVIGVYLPMIESEYKPCYENQFGAKGLFQFMPSTAEHYGVARSDMCDVQKIAPAAAHYIADRMAELGDDSQSMTLVLLSYNRGPNGVTDALRRLREIDVNYERNFWTLFANRDKLDQSFQRESAGYVPQFFAAAIIGENPESFDLQMPPLSSMASAANEKR